LRWEMVGSPGKNGSFHWEKLVGSTGREGLSCELWSTAELTVVS
ncbi:7977_t:CDS:1, partial [Dentiscutata erythropus]